MRRLFGGSSHRSDASLDGGGSVGGSPRSSLAPNNRSARRLTGQSFSVSHSTTSGLDASRHSSDSRSRTRTGDAGRGGIGGEDDPWADEGRLGYALSRFASANKSARPYVAVARELEARARKSKKDATSDLRELCVRVGDTAVLNADFFAQLLAIVRGSKDKDWDRKAVRYAHCLMRAMLTGEGDTDGRVISTPWQARGIGAEHLLAAVDAFGPRGEAGRPFAPRRAAAFQTLALVCSVAAAAAEAAAAEAAGGGGGGAGMGIGGGSGGLGSPVDRAAALSRAATVLGDSVDGPLDVCLGAARQEAAGSGGGVVGKKAATGRHMSRKTIDGSRGGSSAGSERSQEAAALLSALRRAGVPAADPRWLGRALAACTCENAVAARHAFALLLRAASEDPARVAAGLRSHGVLIPTFVGAEGFLGQPNLQDPLACVYYLRTLKALVFSDVPLEEDLRADRAARLDLYRTIANSVKDERHRVALEAMQCLMDHPRAWDLVVGAQRASNDMSIFPRVVARIKQCLDQAMEPAAGGGDGSGWRRDWPLAHAACRVCREVGKTFQRAHSHEMLEQQRRRAASAHAAGGSWQPQQQQQQQQRSPGMGGGLLFSELDDLSAGAIGYGSGGGGGGGGGGGYGSPASPGDLFSTALSRSPPKSAMLTPTPPRQGGVGTGASLSLLDLPATVPGSGTGAGSAAGSSRPPPPRMGEAESQAEEENAKAIRGLCQALQRRGLLDCPHLHVRSLALEAMFLLVPDPVASDPALAALWEWLRRRMEQCPATLPDTVLGELVAILLMRVQCSEAARAAVVPAVLAITESFMRQRPSDHMAACVLRAWTQCIGYARPGADGYDGYGSNADSSREEVLRSVYRVLDSDPPPPPDDEELAAAAAAASHARQGSVSDLDARSGGSGGLHSGYPHSHHGTLAQPPWPGTAAPQLQRQPSAGGLLKRKGSSLTSAHSAVPAMAATPGDYVRRPAVEAYLRARAAYARLKLTALWFLGNYCAELIGVSSSSTSTSTSALPGTTRIGQPPLLAALPESPRAAAVAGGSGSSDGGGSGDAAVSLLMRLQQAALLESFEARRAAAVALGKAALVLPPQLRLEARDFLVGLELGEAAAAGPWDAISVGSGGSGGALFGAVDGAYWDTGPLGPLGLAEAFGRGGDFTTLEGCRKTQAASAALASAAAGGDIGIALRPYLAYVAAQEGGPGADKSLLADFRTLFDTTGGYALAGQ